MLYSILLFCVRSHQNFLGLRRTYFIFFIFGLFLFPMKTHSQGLRWEAGVNVGPAFFLGDLGGNRGEGTNFIKDVNPQFAHITTGVFIAAYPSDFIGIRLAAQLGKLEGSDGAVNTKGQYEWQRKERNLDFKTNISEIYGAVEIFPLMLFHRVKIIQPRLRPYGVIGIGLFHFNPQGSLTDPHGNQTWYYLHSLRTEGEGMKEHPDVKEYKLTQVNIPLGFGIKYFLSEKVDVSWELLYRKTFTDYIDDVSNKYIDPSDFEKYLSSSECLIAEQISNKSLNASAPGTKRGSPHKDAYFNVFLKIGVHFGRQYRNDVRSDLANHSKCPGLF